MHIDLQEHQNDEEHMRMCRIAAPTTVEREQKRPLGAVDRYILAVLGCGTGPKGEKMAAACLGVDSQDLATILDPFWVIFADLGPDRLSAT